MRQARNVLAALPLAVALAGCPKGSEISAKPDRAAATAHLEEANRLSSANRLNEAIAEAQRAKDADPTLGEAYTLRADLYAKSAHFREARDELLAAHKALPDDPQVTIALLYDTQAYFPPAEAEALARKATAQDPSSSEAHYFLGMAIVNGGDPKRRPEALKELEAAHRLNASATGTLTEMAKLYIQEGNAAKALGLLESAAAILDEAKTHGRMPIPVLEDWTKERRGVAFWTADALRRMKKIPESRAATEMANKLSAQSSELRMLQAKLSLTPPDEAARKRLEEIQARGF